MWVKAELSRLEHLFDMNGFNLDERPFLVIWEVTRACSLACRHCRAEAQPHRHPLELNTWEAFGLIEQIARTRPALFVLTGGDPIRRPDLKDLIHYAAKKGLRIGLTPSATPEFLQVDLRELKELGVARLALSLDGASRETHDRFRGVPGTWDWTMQAIDSARAAGIPLQINTTFTRQNLGEFDAFAEVLQAIQPALWSVFQLVPTGRGQSSDLLTAEEMEHLFERLFHLSLQVPYDIKTTEAHITGEWLCNTAAAG
jgi:MoaA/NifB/PqqE/SkfB family radical SAM enzyme